MNYSMDFQDGIREAAAKTTLDLFVIRQIALDVAHGALLNGLKHGYPGMIERSLARIEEIKKQIMELV